MKIVIPDDYPPVITGTDAIKRLETVGDVAIHNSLPKSGAELLERVAGAAIVVNIRSSVRFTEDVLFRMAPTVKLISCWGTGVDHVDLAAAKRFGITVSNTPFVNAAAVAEQTLALMLAVVRRIPAQDRSVKAGQWKRGMTSQCYGKTVGIIGTGTIGSLFARLARAIGMDVIAWTFNPDPVKAREYGFTYVDSLDELLQKSDVVSLHLRSSDRTRGMIGEPEFLKMKKSAVLINTARGDIIDEVALVRAIREGFIAGAGLDVMAKEPPDPDNPLLLRDGVVITPHMGGNTPEVVNEGLMLCAENAVQFIKTGQVLHRVI